MLWSLRRVHVSHIPPSQSLAGPSSLWWPFFAPWVSSHQDTLVLEITGSRQSEKVGFVEIPVINFGFL